MKLLSPDADALTRANDAFERGDYATVRRDLRALLAGSPAPDVRTQAEELLARLAPDRAAIILAIGGLLSLVAIAIAYLG